MPEKDQDSVKNPEELAWKKSEGIICDSTRLHYDTHSIISP